MNGTFLAPVYSRPDMSADPRISRPSLAFPLDDLGLATGILAISSLACETWTAPFPEPMQTPQAVLSVFLDNHSGCISRTNPGNV